MGGLLRQDEMLELSNVTVRLGVTCYPFAKLKELLIGYAAVGAIETTRSMLLQNIEVNLKRGQEEGGDWIISWNPEYGNWVAAGRMEED